MKIGIFSNLYPPSERGGAELIAQRVADELASRGHDVFVVTTMQFSGIRSLRPSVKEHYIERVFRFYPLNFYHLTNAHKYPFPIRLLWHVVDAFGPFPHSFIRCLLLEEKPDAVFTHNLKGFGVGAVSDIQKMGIRHIHTVHDVQLSVPNGVLAYEKEDNQKAVGLFRQKYEQMMKRSIGTPDVVISPSKFLADFYHSRGFFSNSQMKIIPNPAPKYINRTERESALPDGPMRFLFVGQIETHKGIDVLLKAVSRLPFPFELHIVGDGTRVCDIKKHSQIDPRIRFHGFISLEHIRKLMRMCDVVVLPSLCYENSPTVIYESFQVGIPVIASRIGGIPELIQEGENGLLVEPGNVDELVSALIKVAQEREKFWTKTKEIQKNVEKFSLKKYVDELQNLYLKT